MCVARQIWDRFDDTTELIDKNTKGVQLVSLRDKQAFLFSLLFHPWTRARFEKLFVLRFLRAYADTFDCLSRRPLYSPAMLATLIEFSCRRPDTFRFIFSVRYRAFPFVRRPSTSSLSFRFQSTAATLPPPSRANESALLI